MSRGASTTPPRDEIRLYETPDGAVRLDVRLDGDTAWLTRRQIAELFGRDRSVVARHLQSAVEEGELDPAATSAKFARVRTEGGRQVKRRITHYSLDAVVSVGCRINSPQGARFRRWAARVLRDHLLRVHAEKERRVAEADPREAREAPDRVAGAPADETPESHGARTLMEFAARYADAWNPPPEREEEGPEPPPGTGARPAPGRPSGRPLEHDRAREAIAGLRRELMARGEASSLFGHPREDAPGGPRALRAILRATVRTPSGESLRPSREAAAELLYLVVKERPFGDGNKRIGSLLFLLYLKREGVEHRPNLRALEALTLLIAEGAPAGKELLTRLAAQLVAESAG